nr:MAG TPA: hypothetical protein [Caudoviricetes sp.]
MLFLDMFLIFLKIVAILIVYIVELLLLYIR